MFAIGALILTLAADAGAPTPAQQMPACVHIRQESRWVPYGYNHVVIIENGCSKPAACTVSTDVVPQPQNVDVPAAKVTEVTTFMASPQQSFNAKVRCVLR